jgi:hypothetical protein
VGGCWLKKFFCSSATKGSATQIYKAKTTLVASSAAEAVKLFFIVTQHVRDQQLIISLMDYLECGNITGRKEGVDLKVIKFSDLSLAPSLRGLSIL